MLDLEILQISSIILVAATVGGAGWQTLGSSRKSRRVEIGSVPAQSSADKLRLLTILRDLLLVSSLILVASVILSPPLLLNNLGEVSFPFDTSVQVLGLLLIGSGTMLGAWAFRSLGEFAMEKILVVKNHRLIQTGPYQYSRHPMYGATLLIGLGFFLLYLNIVLLILAVLVFSINVHRAQAEENLLSSPMAFGAQYDEYRRRTRKFIPHII